MNTNVVLIDCHRVELHDAFLRYVPQVFPSISFRRWYELGGWTDAYRSFAIFDAERIIANVSVMRMDLIIEGRALTAWQLGAVGVLADYRGRGLQRLLMNHVLRQIPTSEIVFLFANEDVLDFYPLFGFQRIDESFYGADYAVAPHAGRLRRLSIDAPADRELLCRIASSAQPVTERFGSLHSPTVLLWYWSNFHADDFYYDPVDDAIVVAERDMEVLRILDVLAHRPIRLAEYLPALITEPVDYLEFGFTPERLWPSAAPEVEHLESPLFVRGEIALPATPFKFPVLSQT